MIDWNYDTQAVGRRSPDLHVASVIPADDRVPIRREDKDRDNYTFAGKSEEFLLSVHVPKFHRFDAAGSRHQSARPERCPRPGVFVRPGPKRGYDSER